MFSYKTHGTCSTQIDLEIRDGIITDEPNVALVCFSADCTPVLLYDPVRGAVGAVHAGHVPDGGGFARAIGAHETVDRTLGHRQRQIFQGGKVPEGFGYILHFKHPEFLLSDQPDSAG